MRRLHLLLLLSWSSAAAPLSFGVKGGTPLTDAFVYSSNPNRKDITVVPLVGPSYFSYSSKANPYIIGPAIEVRLPYRLGVEVDALYSHVTYHYSMVGPSTSSGVATQERKVRVNTWEFPVLLKYRLPLRWVQPHACGGIAFSRVHAVENTLHGGKPLLDTRFGFRQSSSETPYELKDRSPIGAVIGGGFQFGFRHLQLAPEIRYTRWRSRAFDVASDQIFLRSKDSEAAIFFGIMF